MILQRIRKSYITKGIAAYIAISMFFQITSPVAVYALTGGPSQPEVQSFSPVGTSDMVDLSSGDFNYNIPLLDVGGYPINMVYNGGITMDQEASWVGLGWNINPGVINRNMRGLPDDFDGDEVKKTTYMKPNITVGIDLGFGADELLGKDVKKPYKGPSVGLGIQYNNYNGVSISTSLSMSANLGPLDANLGLQGNSTGGLSISPSVSYAKTLKDKKKRINKKSRTSLGVSFNTIGGLSTASLSHTVTHIYKNGKKKASVSGSQAGTLNLVPNTYTPQMNQERNSLSVSFGVKLGATLFGAKGAADIGAMYSSAWLKKNGKKISYNAYGYLNSEHAGSNAMMDFNREKDAGYNDGTTNLPITNYTYDAYSIQGQGVSGAYRPYRSEVGSVHDNNAHSISRSGNGNIDVAGGNLADLGTDIKVNTSTSYSGVWSQDNEALSLFRFKSQSGNDFENGADDLYEPYYYKQSGELAVDDDPLYSKISGDQPVQIPLQSHGLWGVKALPTLKERIAIGGVDGYKNHNPGVDIQDLGLQRNKRVNRNQLISTLTKKEAALVGVRKYTVPQAEPHHVSEITVTRNDGARYVYGIPVYNNVQKDVTFSISKRGGLPDSDARTGLVSYNPATDDKSENGKGKDEFYSKTELPPFAHSYLISEVLSHDFVDVNDNGADDADYGTYTRFDYDDDLKNYKWRVPYQYKKANFNEGLKAEHQDETASYIYGEKDVRYLDKVETKTHVAIFHKSFRKDAYETSGEKGGKGAKSMKKLDKISLYAKGDWKANYTGNLDYSNLTPIKEVHFEYAQYHDFNVDELCQGTALKQLPNAEPGRGKLTLTKVYFTYGNSYKAKWSPYEFKYEGKNPSYNLKGYNVWGGYKKNSDQTDSGLNSTYNNPFKLAEHGDLTNPEFPYVEQNQTQENENASAWCLTSVELPSGGIINVEYESDDYAYVQNRRAMQMVKIIGANNTDTYSSSNKLYNSGTDNYNTYLFFDKPAGTPTIFYMLNSGVSEEKLYFRFLLDLDNKGHYDFVTGYCEIESYGEDSSDPTKGYVKVKRVHIKDKDSGNYTNPITKAGWNYTRINLPKIAGNQPNNLPAGDGSAQGVKNLAKALANAAMVRDIVNMFRGVNKRLKQEKYAQKFITGKSWIRLGNPDGHKLGGGSRVKSIKMSDEWKGMVSPGAGETSVYGQAYTYDSEFTINEKKISSGVATYEPIQSKENPFIQPIFMSTRHLLVPDDEHFIEKPLGESFFPSPTVTYARVEVKNLVPANVQNHASGKVIHEFYTSKDYPTIVDNDQLTPERRSNLAKFSLIKGFQKDYMTASQGYVVINNDMNGKQKAQWVLPEGATATSEAISGVEYLYNSDATASSVTSSNDDPFESTTVNTRPGTLNNKCMLIHKDGKITSGTIGIEYDAVADFRENSTENTSGGANAGLSTFLVAFFPGIVPSIWPTFSYSHTRFRSAVFTKVINKHGILREVVAHDLGAKVSTKNLAWDAETGEVLLTSVKNEYADEIFTLNYPAHWGYDKMGMASQNVGLNTTLSFSGSGRYHVTSSHYFVEGDELLITDANNNGVKAWVLAIENSGNKIVLIDELGELINSNYTEATIIRSGRRNQQALAIGSITMKKNPIEETSSGSGVYKTLKQVIQNGSAPNLEVLAASAVEYDDNWKALGGRIPSCNTCEEPVSLSGQIVNPFIAGIQGTWRAKQSALYLGERDQENQAVYSFTPNSTLDLREDGLYTSFTPFWVQPAATTKWKKTTTNDWTWASRIGNYTPFGQEVENQDALYRYSSAIFGYNNSLAIAVANNARQNQIAFDGFEDYENFNEKVCRTTAHFKFVCDANRITENESHTGRNSMIVGSPGFNEGIHMKGSLQAFLPTTTINTPCNVEFGDNIPYTIKPCDLITPFGPSTVFYPEEREHNQTAVKYVFSYWQKEKAANETIDYDHIKAQITINGTGILTTPYTKSKIIDGWQKVEYRFEIPNGATGEIEVSFNDPESSSYVDDIRIHPFNSSMKSYVYDPLSLRLWAELDDNNYATFYEYDEEGKLLRIKKETARGIQTIQESRSSNVK